MPQRFCGSRSLLSTLALGALLLGGCDCGGDPPGPECGVDGDCGGEQVCADGMCMDRMDASAALDAGPRTDAGSTRPDAGTNGCERDEQCGDGVCVGGACCASAEAACGESCCGAAEVCFASACVIPGETCATNADCAEGEYCEPGLGEGGPPPDAGMPDGGVTCGVGATAGRCLALPPSCDDAPAGEPCIATTCEFRPPVGTLEAVPQWRWDPDTIVEFPEHVDVWSTPTVGRIHDTNCDGAVDALDPPAIVFVSRNISGGACHSGGLCRQSILRALDGATGRELWSLEAVDETSVGFTGVSTAMGDLDDDGVMDVVVMTGEGRLAAIRGDGTVLAVGTDVLPYTELSGLGWGGGLALGDMEGDGDPEIGWRGAVYTYADGAFTERFNVAGVRAGWPHGTVSTSTSFFVNLDADPELELLAGRTAVDTDGSILWQTGSEGFAAVADFDMDGAPEVALVGAGMVWVIEGATGAIELGPVALSGTGAGGPPTIADFDGDGRPEIGVATATFYNMLDPNYPDTTIDSVWTSQNHDNSSSVTGSTVFDFEGDGIAEVIYNDECFMWVYDGPTGDVRFVAPTNSFTGTEASLVADVDGDGHAEMVMISTGANPVTWHCGHHQAASAEYPAWAPPTYGNAWRGLSVFRDVANGWVGTRTLWTQHAYHVTNTCDDRDSACSPSMGYGAIPTAQRRNWELPWLNNFRQNVQDEGIFDAPDATVSLRARCVSPVELTASVRNLGRAVLAAGVEVGFFTREGATETQIASAATGGPIFPGRVEELTVTAPAGVANTSTFFARILIDPATVTFRECRDDNNESDEVVPRCLD